MRLSSPRWDRRGSGRGCRSIRSICITSPRRWDTPRCSALGLALAQPEREVIAFNGDGCMLMSLGCLVTIVASGAKNLTLIVLENGVYEVTGGQHTAGDAAHVDFIGMARAAGFTSSARFTDLEDWRARAAEALAIPGPRFIVLEVARVADHELVSPGPMQPRLARFGRARHRLNSPLAVEKYIRRLHRWPQIGKS